MEAAFYQANKQSWLELAVKENGPGGHCLWLSPGTLQLCIFTLSQKIDFSSRSSSVQGAAAAHSFAPKHHYKLPVITFYGEKTGICLGGEK